jgi:methionine-rich copper-binding protein CopC
LTLNFSEGVEPGFSGATLTGSNKEQIQTERKASRSGWNKTRLFRLIKHLGLGKYTVDWHVVSVDGHKTEGDVYL